MHVEQQTVGPIIGTFCKNDVIKDDMRDSHERIETVLPHGSDKRTLSLQLFTRI